MTVFHKTGPWCQKGGGPLLYRVSGGLWESPFETQMKHTERRGVWGEAKNPLEGSRKTSESWQGPSLAQRYKRLSSWLLRGVTLEEPYLLHTLGTAWLLLHWKIKAKTTPNTVWVLIFLIFQPRPPWWLSYSGVTVRLQWASTWKAVCQSLTPPSQTPHRPPLSITG